MTRLMIDTSVLIKWFHDEGENEVSEARAIRDAHVRGDLDAHILDLAIYEVGNVLARGLNWTAARIGDRMAKFIAIVGSPIVMAQGWFRDAAALAQTHTLSFYDASWAATAIALRALIWNPGSRRLLAAGLATRSAIAVAAQLAS